MATRKLAQVAETATAEAENEDVTFEYDGEEYSVPSAKSWPLEAFEAVEDNKFVSFARHVLGEEQYAKFKAGKKRGVKDLVDIMDAARIAADVDQGK